MFPKENEHGGEYMELRLDLKRLKAERIAKGYTQEEMANYMGYKDRASYAKRENGFVNLGADELAKITEILEIPIENMYIFFTLTVPEKERNHQSI
jgi:transcriptional regulator with XRE-family HTH domain